MGMMKRTIEKHVLLLVLSIMMLGLAACGPAPDVAVAPEDEVFFPDSNLETAVRRAIGKYQDPIQASDLEELTSLSLAGRNVVDLTGLDRAVNLEWLEIHDSRIGDVSPLAPLRNLNGLVMEVNQIGDMSPLDSLTGLVVHRTVTFPDKRFEDAIRETMGKARGPIYIDELEGLVFLSLAGSDISDLTGLEYFASLERLELHGNRISDLSSLAALDNLAELVLDPEQIEYLLLPHFLTGVFVLEAVAFPDRNLEAAIRETIDKPEGSISPSDLEEVTSLSLSGQMITDLTGLEYCVNLKTLEINDNWIGDMSSLAALTNLTSLVVDSEQVEDASLVASLTGVRVLEIVDIPDETVEAALRGAIGKPEGAIYASELEQIESFSLTGIRIEDLTGLGRCTGLTRLSLEESWISDIAPLAGLSNLSVLSLRGNRISDVTPLAGLSNLSVLSLRDNRVTDIAPLAGLSNLSILSLGDNQITNIAPLARLSNLNELYVDDNEIRDVSPLASLDNLVSVWLQGNEPRDVSPLASLKNLATLVLDAGDAEDASQLTLLADTAILLAVSFPDANLEAAVREAIAKPEGPVYAHEVEALTALSLSGLDVVDLTGLEYCTNLKRLELHDNEISDISSLASLTSLTRLYLHDNEIIDISPLALLVNLTDLRLHNNLIVDIEPLVANSGLSAPDAITLANNPLDSASRNSGIPELEQRGVTVQW